MISDCYRDRVEPEVRESVNDVAVRLRSVIGRLSRHLNASASSEGLTPSQASVLGLLNFHGRLASAELARLEGLNPTMVSRILGRLEELALVRRTPNADDLRVVTVEITDTGRSLGEQVRAAQSAVVAERLAELDPHEQHAIDAAIPALEALSAALFARRK